MARVKEWTSQEEKLLQENYDLRWDKLLSMLPGRTKSSINHKLVRMGYRRTYSALDGEKDYDYIRKNIMIKTAKEISRDLDVSHQTVNRALKKMGIKLNSNTWKQTKFEINPNKPFTVCLSYELDLEGDDLH
ncbi:MAG: hypothetical protein WD512_12590 [Candidatus Paceibacterota bacterium]